MEDVKKNRSTAKRLFTFAIKSAESLLSGPVPTEDQLNKAYEKLENMYDSLCEANENVIKNLPVDIPVSEIEDNIDYLREVNVIRSRITAEFQRMRALIQKEAKVTTVSTDKAVPVKSQLERLKIQTFSGNIREYPSWRFSFVSNMNKYAQDREEQLQRIKEAVQPPARKDVLHCMTIDSALEILDQNYGNVDELMSLLLRDIKSYKPLKNGHSNSLKSFASVIRSFIVRFVDLGKTHDLKSDYIVVDLLDKLIIEDQYKYKSMCHDKHLPKTLETLVSWLGIEAQLRSSMIDDGKKVSAPRSNPVSVKASNSRTCILKCSQFHLLRNCPVFNKMKVSDRWDLIKANKCCFCCLKVGHLTRFCFEKRKCNVSNCDNHHHPLLHENVDDNTKEANASTSNVNSIINCGNLPVVRVKVYDQFGVPHLATALIDSGSQRSLVKKSFVNKMRLKGDNLQNIHIRLAAGQETFVKSRVYNLRMSALDSNVIYQLNVNSLETVCGDIPPFDKQDLCKFPHLSGLVGSIYCDGGPVEIFRVRTLPGKPGKSWNTTYGHSRPGNPGI